MFAPQLLGFVSPSINWWALLPQMILSVSYTHLTLPTKA